MNTELHYKTFTGCELLINPSEVDLKTSVTTLHVYEPDTHETREVNIMEPSRCVLM